MTITKAELAEALFDELGLNKRAAKEFVELFFDEIKHNLNSDTNVKLSSFGNFVLRDKSARPGRNPKTGQDATVSARRVVTFHCGQKLKAKIEAYAGSK